MLYVWYPKNRTDLNTILKENDVIETEELARVKAELTGLLQDSYKSPIRLLSRDYKTSYQEITGLLSRDHKTSINLLQISYQEIIRLLSRDYRTPIKRL